MGSLLVLAESSSPVKAVHRFSSWILITLLYTCGFLCIASSEFRQYGFPLDDSYIYQTVARSLASGAPGFIPGQHAGGATSFLWVYLQAANYAIFHHYADPILYNLALSWLLLVLIGHLLYAIASQDGLPPLSRWGVAASPALCGNFLWLGMIGMEHLLFVALSLAAIYFRFLPWAEPRTGRNTLYAGIALGLIAVTRPEAIALGPVLMLSGAKKYSRRDLLLTLAPWLVAVTGYFAWSFRNFGSLLPSTLKGRSWLWFRIYGGPHSAKALAEFFRQWLQRLPRQFFAHFVTTQMRLTSGNRLFTLLVLIIVVLMAIGLYALLREKTPRVQFLLLWAGLHALLYIILLPATGHGGRYQPLFLLLLFPLLFSGVSHLVTQALQTELPAAVALTVLIAAAGASSLYAWRSVTILSTELINETHGRMAAWIITHLPQNTKLAAFDSGRISYELTYAITDMGGLADQQLLPYLTTGHVLQYLELHGVEYFVLPELEKQEMSLFDASRPQAQSVAEFCVSTQLFENAYSYTENAWRCQHLFRLENQIAGQLRQTF